MQRAQQEIKAGWREARWSLYFGLIGLPLTLLAYLLAYGIEGRVSDPPSGLTWTLIVVAGLLSAFLTGLWDGPDGRFGRYVWFLIFLGFVIRLLWRVQRDRRRNQPTRLRFAGIEFTISLEGDVSAKLAEKRFGWKDLRRLRWRAVGSNSDRQLLVGV